jgi:CxxH/CxxC protein (TIGR04129 family)
VCCEEHLDESFDDFLMEYETFPVMKDAKDEVCNYCSKPGRYILELSEDKA